MQKHVVKLCCYAITKSVSLSSSIMDRNDCKCNVEIATHAPYLACKRQIAIFFFLSFYKHRPATSILFTAVLMVGDTHSNFTYIILNRSIFIENKTPQRSVINEVQLPATGDHTHLPPYINPNAIHWSISKPVGAYFLYSPNKPLTPVH